MHGILGQLATDPVRLAVSILALVAAVAILRCLSGLAFFSIASREERTGKRREQANRRQDR